MNGIPMDNFDDDCQIILLKYWLEDPRPFARTRKRNHTGYVKDSNTIVTCPDLPEIAVVPWVEDLSRPPNSHNRKVTLPAYFDNIFHLPTKTTHVFSWNKIGHSVDRDFWLTLLGYSNRGWLSDKLDDDWAIAGSYLCALVMRGEVPFWPANRVKYPVPWTEVDRVFIPINEPKKHYCLAVLHIMSGVITLYDSLGVPSIEHRDWWKKIRLAFEAVIPTYLDDCGVLKAKCTSIETYKVKFEVADNVPIQGNAYGDFGVWVCIFLHRLCQNLPVSTDHDPTHVGLAYREHMVDYLWKYKIPEPRFKSTANCG
ncbi:ulp1 protease family, C-terminal catalytic domain-containing protein [Tanacetum coccineum]|uniref:Ulp1 protease family, C-terminal catalytic domain-containing protein n=1 Tax=Tanacetum coccineum TaxID=301880 RepID=A0ABQ5ALR5_9ASTR